MYNVKMCLRIVIAFLSSALLRENPKQHLRAKLTPMMRFPIAPDQWTTILSANTLLEFRRNGMFIEKSAFSLEPCKGGICVEKSCIVILGKTPEAEI